VQPEAPQPVGISIASSYFSTVRKLGSGGYGDVFEVKVPGSEYEFALKVPQVRAARSLRAVWAGGLAGQRKRAGWCQACTCTRALPHLPPPARPPQEKSEEARTDLLKEASLHAKVGGHRNILTMFGVTHDDDGKTDGMLMEVADGSTFELFNPRP